MSDLVVTVPRQLWSEWIEEGDAVGEPESGEEWGFFLGPHRPSIEPGERLYIVAHDRLRGFAPVTRVAFFPYSCPDHAASDAIGLGIRAALTDCKVCRGALEGLANRPRAIRGRWAIGRKGGAVAVTLSEKIRGFRGWRKRWWNLDDERPFPHWATADLVTRKRSKSKASPTVTSSPTTQGKLFD